MILPFYCYIIGAVLVLIILILALGYTKASPDVAKVISGLSKEPRILAGRAGLRIPFFERVDELFLGQISVDIQTTDFIPTKDFINVKIDGVAKIRVDQEKIQAACKNFLNKEPMNIGMELQDTLQGNMREIIGTLELKAINQDRDSFSKAVINAAGEDMSKLGIEILSFNIQNITDEHGLINDMGMDNTAKIKKDAAIAKAQADKEVAIAQAEADQAANEARVKADTEIAKKKNELEIQKANLKKEADIAKAQSDAAYEIQKQEQEKTLQTRTIQAQIAKAEEETKLREQQIAIKEKELEAEKKKLADAEKYAAEKAAEAELARQQREAEAIKAKGEAEAAAIEAKGKAEAAAIKAKGEAEAEAMNKKAEAYKKYNNAAIAEMMLNILPQMAEQIAKPLSQINDINIYGGSVSDGVSQISGNSPAVIKQVFDTVSKATGVELSEVLKAETYAAKVDKNINAKIDTESNEKETAKIS